MTLTIGRFTTQRDPASVDHNGDSLSFGGMLFASSLDDLDVQRQQLLGLDGNEDEPDVPVTWSRDDGIDGYYTVKSVSVTPIRAVTYNQFKFQYAVQLTRVQGGFAAPLCEVAVSIAVRTNGHAVTVPVGTFGVPGTATFSRGAYASGTQMTFQGERSAESGSVFMISAKPASGSFGAWRCAVLPADHYDGAAAIEQSVGGVWYPVVGDQVGSVVGNQLRLSNGLVRFTFHTNSAITAEVWDGTVWESSTQFFMFGSPGAQEWEADGGWRVLKNAPDACTIQASARTHNSGIDRRTVTLHLPRGSMLVHISADGLYKTTDSPLTFDESLKLGTYPGTVVAATALTGGIRQTTDDANGHRWMMLSPSAVTKDLVNGTITIAAPGAPLVAQFALGWERGGSTSALEYDAVAIADAYFAALSTRQRVVSQ